MIIGTSVRRLTAVAAGVLLAAVASAARIGLDPLMGDGAAGRTTVLTGSGFEPGATFAVSIGGYPVGVSAPVTANGSGVLPVTTLYLPDLPRGNLDVMLASPALTRSFTGAFRVWPNICLTPVVGDGRRGDTHDTLPAIPDGGWTGMVIRIEGTGFAGGYTIPANTITVGGAATIHPAIPVSVQGRFGSATIIVASNLPFGFKDIVINDGFPQLFASAYRVRRSIGMTPARGLGANNATIYIEGWGFAAGSTGAITIGAATVTPATLAVAADGSFAGIIRLNGNPGDTRVAVATGQETFPGCFDDCKAAHRQAGIVPVTPLGLPNQAIRVQGMGNWASGQTILRDTTQILVPGANVPTVHDPIPITGGRFAPAWIVATQGIELDATGVVIIDPVAGASKCEGFYSQRIVSVCPVMSGGQAGFTATVTGWGFDGAANITAVSVGGTAATYPARTVAKGGDIEPMWVSVAALPNGDADLAITDSALASFSRAFHVRRTIGLSFVTGPGTVGDITSIKGYGFAAGTIAANAIDFAGASPEVTHGAITVVANGSFAPAPLTLPLLGAGPWDVVAQAEAFPQAYRVANPVMAVAKHRDPAFAGLGATVTYTLSYTNASLVGDPRATGVVLMDTLPSKVRYLAGTAASTLPATIEWYHPSCSCWNAVETPGTDITALRWIISSPLPAGASGYASFQVQVW